MQILSSIKIQIPFPKRFSNQMVSSLSRMLKNYEREISSGSST